MYTQPQLEALESRLPLQRDSNQNMLTSNVAGKLQDIVGNTRQLNTGFNDYNVSVGNQLQLLNKTAISQLNTLQSIYSLVESKLTVIEENSFSQNQFTPAIKDKLTRIDDSKIDKNLSKKFNVKASFANLVRTSSAQMMRLYDNNSDKQIALLSGIYEFQRFFAKDLIAKNSKSSKKSAVATDDKIKNALDKGPRVNIYDKIKEGGGAGLGHIAAGTLKAASWLTGMALAPLKPGVLEMSLSKMRTSLGLVDWRSTEDLMAASGLRGATPEERSYDFLGDGFPTYLAGQESREWTMIEHLRNIYDINSDMSEAITGQKRNYNDTLYVNEKKVKRYDAATGEYLSEKQYQENINRYALQIAQQKETERGFFGSVGVNALRKLGGKNNFFGVHSDADVGARAAMGINKGFTRAAADDEQATRAYEIKQENINDTETALKIGGIVTNVVGNLLLPGGPIAIALGSAVVNAAFSGMAGRANRVNLSRDVRNVDTGPELRDAAGNQMTRADFAPGRQGDLEYANALNQRLNDDSGTLSTIIESRRNNIAAENEASSATVYSASTSPGLNIHGSAVVVTGKLKNEVGRQKSLTADFMPTMAQRSNAQLATTSVLVHIRNNAYIFQNSVLSNLQAIRQSIGNISANSRYLEALRNTSDASNLAVQIAGRLDPYIGDGGTAGSPSLRLAEQIRIELQKAIIPVVDLFQLYRQHNTGVLPVTIPRASLEPYIPTPIVGAETGLDEQPISSLKDKVLKVGEAGQEFLKLVGNKISVLPNPKTIIKNVKDGVDQKISRFFNNDKEQTESSELIKFNQILPLLEDQSDTLHKLVDINSSILAVTEANRKPIEIIAEDLEEQSEDTPNKPEIIQTRSVPTVAEIIAEERLQEQQEQQSEVQVEQLTSLEKIEKMLDDFVQLTKDKAKKATDDGAGLGLLGLLAVGGIAAMAWDTIKGMMDDYSKTGSLNIFSNLANGVFGVDGKKDVLSSFKAMGKYGVIGAGIGFISGNLMFPIFGGMAGALVGGIVGAGIGWLLNDIYATFKESKAAGGGIIQSSIKAIFGTDGKSPFATAGKYGIMGAGIGFMIGSLPGAFAGAAIGAGIGYVVNSIQGLFQDKKDSGAGIFSSMLTGFFGSDGKSLFATAGKYAMYGGGIGFIMGSIPGAILGGIIGAGVGYLVDLIPQLFPKLDIFGMLQSFWDLPNQTIANLGLDGYALQYATAGADTTWYIGAIVGMVMGSIVDGVVGIGTWIGESAAKVSLMYDEFTATPSPETINSMFTGKNSSELATVGSKYWYPGMILGGMIGAIADTIIGIGTWLTEGITKLKDKSISLISDIIPDSVKSFFGFGGSQPNTTTADSTKPKSSIWEDTKSTASGAWESAKNVANDTLDSAKSAASGAASTVSSIAGNAWSGLKGIGGDVLDAAKNVSSKVSSFAGNAVGAAKKFIDGARWLPGSEGIPEMISNVAKKYGIDDKLMQMMAMIESKGRPNAYNSGSGASGVYQFIPSTGAAYGLNEGNKFDPNANINAGAHLLLDNIKGLQKKGIPVTPGTVYLAHQQGLGGLNSVYKAAKNNTDVGEDTRKNMNSNYGQGKTPAEFLSMWDQITSTIYSKISGVSNTVPSATTPDTQQTTTQNAPTPASSSAISTQPVAAKSVFPIAPASAQQQSSVMFQQQPTQNISSYSIVNDSIDGSEKKPSGGGFGVDNAPMASSALNKGLEGFQTGNSNDIPNVAKSKPSIHLDRIHPEIYNRFADMAAEYKSKTGKDLPVNSAWRSPEEQNGSIASARKGYAAKQGKSLHQWGYALDVSTSAGNELAKMPSDKGGSMLDAYGFFRPMLSAKLNEPWHIEPKEIAGTRSQISSGFVPQLNAIGTGQSVKEEAAATEQTSVAATSGAPAVDSQIQNAVNEVSTPPISEISSNFPDPMEKSVVNDPQIQEASIFPSNTTAMQPKIVASLVPDIGEKPPRSSVDQTPETLWRSVFTSESGLIPPPPEDGSETFDLSKASVEQRMSLYANKGYSQAKIDSNEAKVKAYVDSKSKPIIAVNQDSIKDQKSKSNEDLIADLNKMPATAAGSSSKVVNFQNAFKNKQESAPVATPKSVSKLDIFKNVDETIPEGWTQNKDGSYARIDDLHSRSMFAQTSVSKEDMLNSVREDNINNEKSEILKLKQAKGAAPGYDQTGNEKIKFEDNLGYTDSKVIPTGKAVNYAEGAKEISRNKIYKESSLFGSDKTFEGEAATWDKLKREDPEAYREAVGEEIYNREKALEDPNFGKQIKPSEKPIISSPVTEINNLKGRELTVNDKSIIIDKDGTLRDKLGNLVDPDGNIVEKNEDVSNSKVITQPYDVGKPIIATPFSEVKAANDESFKQGNFSTDQIAKMRDAQYEKEAANSKFSESEQSLFSTYSKYGHEKVGDNVYKGKDGKFYDKLGNLANADGSMADIKLHRTDSLEGIDQDVISKYSGIKAGSSQSQVQKMSDSLDSTMENALPGGKFKTDTNLTGGWEKEMNLGSIGQATSGLSGMVSNPISSISNAFGGLFDKVSNIKFDNSIEKDNSIFDKPETENNMDLGTSKIREDIQNVIPPMPIVKQQRKSTSGDSASDKPFMVEASFDNFLHEMFTSSPGNYRKTVENYAVRGDKIMFAA